ncbi:DUF2306 domain-containing protein [Arthrobacter sp. CJ23]|uniref:DUF2306 domain-containing protein n=1 Tax=Arthrobacter sp. CJ23 TaxID=2972479 RepID=UPI00215D2917|nr:DUF2306 domain-containing protein [Arthrobacter sp. CJ23]UVJ38510.1 DUF2306 domain-containing protein [Arthrobacter sp. CJ23]
MEHWNVLLVSHVVAALFVLAVGPVQILRRRRDRVHRTVGYLWMAAMYYVCLSSFWIVSDGHFSWLHGLSAFTLMTVTLGVVSAIRRNIPAHRGNMVGSYIGTAIAFGFAVAVPGRAIPRLLASDPGSAVFVAVLVVGAVAAVYLSLLRGQKTLGQKYGNGRRRPLAAVDRSPAGRA